MKKTNFQKVKLDSKILKQLSFGAQPERIQSQTLKGQSQGLIPPALSSPNFSNWRSKLLQRTVKNKQTNGSKRSNSLKSRGRLDMGSFEIENLAEMTEGDIKKTRIFNIPKIQSKNNLPKKLKFNRQNLDPNQEKKPDLLFENKDSIGQKNGLFLGNINPKNNLSEKKETNKICKKSKKIQESEGTREFFPILEKECLKQFGPNQSAKDKFRNKFFSRSEI